MNINNEVITVNIKTNKFGPTVRVGESWVQTSEELYNKLEKGKSYSVEIQTDDKGKKKLTKIIEQKGVQEVKKPAYEKKVSETSKAEFRSPDQIMRSSAIGISLSFVAQTLQNDLETSLKDKAKLAFELAPEIEKYIQGE
jgi:hypothetical protein